MDKVQYCAQVINLTLLMLNGIDTLLQAADGVTPEQSPVYVTPSIDTTSRTIKLYMWHKHGDVNKVIGIASGVQDIDDPKIFYVGTVCIIEEKNRGKKLGTRLMQEMLQLIRQQKKYTHMTLSAIPDNPTTKDRDRLIGFYKKFGGKVIGKSERCATMLFDL